MEPERYLHNELQVGYFKWMNRMRTGHYGIPEADGRLRQLTAVPMTMFARSAEEEIRSRETIEE